MGVCGATVTIVTATATDNCSVGTTTGIRSDALSLTALYPVGVTTITWTVTDTNGNAGIAKIQTVTVTDNIKPTIACVGDKTRNTDTSNCSYTVIGSEFNPSSFGDNCTGSTISNNYNNNSTLAGAIFPRGLTTVVWTVKDASGNTSSCSFTVTVQSTLALDVTNSNPQLYFGYALDQSSIITGKPSGGTAPYKVVITMNRSLSCNVVSSSGDEIWTGGTGTSSSVGTTCPSSGLGSIPSSTAITINTGGSYAVTATLMANATFTVTVTDKNGCTVSQTTNVYSEDDRCFAGNSSIAKIKICHKTGNSNDPCHELCVDQSAVQAHLAHGDYIGSCLPLCATPTIHTKIVKVKKELVEPALFNVIAYPNPTDNQFTIVIEGGSDEKVEVLVYDSLGRIVKHIDNSDGQQIKFGDGLPSGAYIAIVSQGSNQKTIRLIKE